MSDDGGSIRRATSGFDPDTSSNNDAAGAAEEQSAALRHATLDELLAALLADQPHADERDDVLLRAAAGDERALLDAAAQCAAAGLHDAPPAGRAGWREAATSIGEGTSAFMVGALSTLVPGEAPVALDVPGLAISISKVREASRRRIYLSATFS